MRPRWPRIIILEFLDVRCKLFVKPSQIHRKKTSSAESEGYSDRKTTISQVHENLHAADLKDKLTPDLLERIESILRNDPNAQNSGQDRKVGRLKD